MQKIPFSRQGAYSPILGGIFGYHLVSQSDDTVILCKDEIDAMLAWQATSSKIPALAMPALFDLNSMKNKELVCRIQIRWNFENFESF